MKYTYLACTLGTLAITGNINSQSKIVNQPNIIFILTDDYGYGDLGVLYQNQRARLNEPSSPWENSPNLDRMARDGVLLTDHYCAAPVSAPSRSSILTGKSQGHSNLRDNQFDKALENNYTLGSVMRTAGYATLAIGKWGVQGKDDQEPDWSAHPLNRGFDYFFGYMRHLDGHEHYPKEGPHGGPKQVWENRTELSTKLDKCYTTDLWTAVAKKWIIEHKKGKESNKPFMMYLAYDTPHAVLELPTQSYPDGGGLKGGIQWTGKPGHILNTASGKIDSWIHPDYAKATYDDDNNPITPQVGWPDVYKRYATSTRRIDDAVGDIIQLLKDLKIDQNTLIVFTSDNGPSIESYLKESIKPTFFRSFGPFDGIKRDCLEGGVRVPTVVHWPGHILTGKTINVPSISYDWMSTFADIAGLPAPAVSDGVSILPSLTGKGEQIPSQIYIEYFGNGTTPDFKEFTSEHRGLIRRQMQMIRLGDLVGIRYNIKSGADNFSIYNITNDPQESNDLSIKPEMKSVQQSMKDLCIQSRRPNETAPRPYDNELIASVKGINTKQGINWKMYRGNYPWVPQVFSLRYTESGNSENISDILSKTGNNNVVYLEGFLDIPFDGEYKFIVNTNGKAVLRVHNATVIDADYNYFSNSSLSGSIKLKSGLHPYRIFFLRNSNQEIQPSLQFEWSGPGISEQSIPNFYFKSGRI